MSSSRELAASRAIERADARERSRARAAERGSASHPRAGERASTSHPRAPGLADASRRSPSGLRKGMPREQLAKIQRSRLLAAAVAAVDELGCAGTTVAHITARARISRRTFYELFSSRDECLAAVLRDAVATIEGEIAEANRTDLCWRERVRTGLAAILSFFDSEPMLARLCVVHAIGAGEAVAKDRERILASVAAVIDEGRSESPRGARCTALTSEGLVGAALAILHARLARRDARPLMDLFGELMEMIALPYLGAAAARRERTRPVPRLSGVAGGPRSHPRSAADPLTGVRMRLTYRTAMVLEGVWKHPGASNRAVSDYAGIHDQGQASKLLARLERLGLVAKGGSGQLKGEPNAWTLTARGEQVTHSIRMHTHNQRQVSH